MNGTKLRTIVVDEASQDTRHPFVRRAERVSRRTWRWLGMVRHSLFWRTVHFFGVGRQVSVFLCRMDLYTKHKLNGRCSWCGNIHDPNRQLFEELRNDMLENQRLASHPPMVIKLANERGISDEDAKKLLDAR